MKKISTLSPSKNNVFNFSVTVTIILAFLYASIRAYVLSISYDEAITVLIHASNPINYILDYTGYNMNSNNHLLNTFLIKGLMNLFGMSEFIVRVPALIGCLLYLIGMRKILGLFLEKWSLVLGMCLLIFHPFMVDFFSCARGYSLGLGFFTLALYYLFKKIDLYGSNEKINYFALASFMLVMSAISNLAFINPLLAVVLIFIILELKDLTVVVKKKQSINTVLYQFYKRILLPVSFIIVALALVYVKPVIVMILTHVSYYGGNQGFWIDTLGSLLDVTLYGKKYFNADTIFGLKLIIVMLFLSGIGILIYKVIKRKRFVNMDRYLLWSVFGLGICSLIVPIGHHLFDIRYIMNRAGIYFIPMFLIFILLLWKQTNLLKNKRVRIIGNYLFLVPMVFLLIHYANCINFTHFHLWKYDAATKNMMNYLNEKYRDKALRRDSIKMGMHWIFEPSISYYIVKNRMAWMSQTDRKGLDEKFDYYYLLEPDKNIELMELLGLEPIDSEEYDLEVIKRFEIPNTYLAVPTGDRLPSGVAQSLKTIWE